MKKSPRKNHPLDFLRIIVEERAPNTLIVRFIGSVGYYQASHEFLEKMRKNKPAGIPLGGPTPPLWNYDESDDSEHYRKTAYPQQNINILRYTTR